MANVTPMMVQYLDIKSAHADALLFYRMGDFYEMFFDDAVAAAEALDIALTKRGKHDGEDIPMCGVPVHAAEGYLLTLIRKGFRVAVCEQMESPAEAKKRGSKSVVKRDVVRLVTPGTLTEDALLEARRHNYLAAYAQVRDEAALAWADISTGAFHIMAITPVRLGPELARVAPAELLVPEALEGDVRGPAADLDIPVIGLSQASFDSTNGAKRLCDVFGVSSLDAFGMFARSEIAAMAGLVDYLAITQKGKLPLLRPPQKDRSDRVVQIDAATRRNLELTQALSGGRAGSLLATIDRTVTPGGARMLERHLSSPSLDLDLIQGRLTAISFFHANASLREVARDLLRKTPDMDRALSRLALDRGGPRDLSAIRNALSQGASLRQAIRGSDAPAVIDNALSALQGFESLVELLDDALVADPPLLVRDGGFVAAGYDEELDEARTLRDEGRSVIAGLQRSYADQTGVASLKIKHNNVLGYFIETTATHADRMMSAPLAETFIHRQTTANQVRFTTLELSALETKILNAGNRALEIEKSLYEGLRAQVLEQGGELAQAALSLSQVDLSAGLADLALAEDWVAPKVDNSRDFAVTGGRHPVVEHALKAQDGGAFVANDCDLSTERIWLLTGPNMAGKSTFLRQNALIALLAQMGSYVPAQSASVGLVSQIFSRVGASDDLARGRSTFMVEMVETAAILNQADDRALVILDEIGRGTATYDGLSIAWATLEHLHGVNKSRALFATHYHELTALAGQLDGADNATVAVKEWDGKVVFLHEVRKGAADRSYGVQVAQLAGLPQSVISRARAVLDALEQGDREGGKQPKALIDDLPLFAAAPPPVQQTPSSTPLEDLLSDINPDAMSPREALDVLYRLKDAAT